MNKSEIVEYLKKERHLSPISDRQIDDAVAIVEKLDDYWEYDVSCTNNCELKIFIESLSHPISIDQDENRICFYIDDMGNVDIEAEWADGGDSWELVHKTDSNKINKTVDVIYNFVNMFEKGGR